MIRTVFFLFPLFSSSPLFSQLPHEQDSAWIRDHYIKIERSIPMRDGVKLFTAIYMPRDQFLNIYTAKDSDYRKATIRIHFDRNSPSAMMLPIMKK